MDNEDLKLTELLKQVELPSDLKAKLRGISAKPELDDLNIGSTLGPPSSNSHLHGRYRNWILVATAAALLLAVGLGFWTLKPMSMMGWQPPSLTDDNLNPPGELIESEDQLLNSLEELQQQLAELEHQERMLILEQRHFRLVQWQQIAEQKLGLVDPYETSQKVLIGIESAFLGGANKEIIRQQLESLIQQSTNSSCVEQAQQLIGKLDTT